jgi:hypothetical protein
MDDDRSKSLSRYEFEKACKEYKMEFSSDDIGLLF